MKLFLHFIYFLQVAILPAATTRWTEEDRALESQQIDLWRAKVSASTAWSDEKKLEEFVLGLKSMSYRSQMDEHDPEIDRIYKQMQQVVISIPGHAKYFTDKIEESWKSNAESVRFSEAQPEWQALLKKMEDTAEGAKYMFDLHSRMWGDYGEIRSKNLGILGHIPSTESVGALGHYLWKRDEPGIRYKSPDTERPAAESLTELIADGPIQIWMASAEDVQKWQKWFDEVKAGKRTFRFVGSDVDYTLDGPADARTLERIRNQNSSGQHSDGRKKHAMAPEKQASPNKMGAVFPGGLIAAILLCSATLVFFLKRRSVA
ncbi:MAG: hypothetical protein ABIT37_17195 [Luteolibacter sp.]